MSDLARAAAELRDAELAYRTSLQQDRYQAWLQLRAARTAFADAFLSEIAPVDVTQDTP